MKQLTISILTVLVMTLQSLNANNPGKSDSIKIYNLGHASLMFEYNNLVIYVDPTSTKADFTGLPKADIFIITHAHGDHYDVSTLNKLKKEGTIMVYTQDVADKGNYSGSARIMKNGDNINVLGIPIKAVPAYNLDKKFHPKGIGNGYIINFREKTIYIAGDTEKIPEMDNLGKIDIAFIPMNLPYTMTPEMAAETAKAINPGILYIYHYGSSDTDYLKELLKGEDMEIRIGYSIHTESSTR